jgi:hypothetical protein
VHATQVRPVLLVDLERRLQFRENVTELARLDAGCRTTSVSVANVLTIRDRGSQFQRVSYLPVHRIALPDHDMSTRLDSFNMCSQH